MNYCGESPISHRLPVRAFDAIRQLYVSPRNMRLLPLVLCLQSVVAQTCYNTDQTEHTLGIPCDPSGQSKQCCLYNSACLDNGLCLFGDDLGMNTGSCMDETWDHASCFSECRDGKFRCYKDLHARRMLCVQPVRTLCSDHRLTHL